MNDDNTGISQIEYIRLAKKFPWIVKWCRMMGSYQYYVEKELVQAEEDDAPTNAIHSDVDGSWKTTDDIKLNETRRFLGLEEV